MLICRFLSFVVSDMPFAETAFLKQRRGAALMPGAGHSVIVSPPYQRLHAGTYIMLNLNVGLIHSNKSCQSFAPVRRPYKA